MGQVSQTCARGDWLRRQILAAKYELHAGRSPACVMVRIGGQLDIWESEAEAVPDDAWTERHDRVIARCRWIRRHLVAAFNELNHGRTPEPILWRIAGQVDVWQQADEAEAETEPDLDVASQMVSDFGHS